MIYRLVQFILSNIEYIQRCKDCIHEVKKEGRYWTCSLKSIYHYNASARCTYYIKKWWKFPKKLYSEEEICKGCVRAEWDELDGRMVWCKSFVGSSDMSYIDGTCNFKKPSSTHCQCGKIRTGKQVKYCSEKCGKKANSKRWRQKKWRAVNATVKANKIKKKQKRKELIRQEELRRNESFCKK